MKQTPGCSNQIEIDGILVPYAWSPDNKVESVCLHSTGELEFLIGSETKIEKELLVMLGRRVLIKGRLSRERKCPRLLLVDTYQMIDW